MSPAPLLPRHRRRLPWPLALAFVLLALPRAWAQSPTVFIQNSPGSGASAIVEGGIPASGSFTLAHTFPDELDSPELQVWPRALAKCNEAPPSPSGPQTYTLPMALSDRAPYVGTVHVPHLQTGQHFCFRIKWLSRAAPDREVLERRVREAIGTLANEDPLDLAAIRRMADKLIVQACEGKDTCRPPNGQTLALRLFPRIAESRYLPLSEQLDLAEETKAQTKPGTPAFDAATARVADLIAQRTDAFTLLSTALTETAMDFLSHELRFERMLRTEAEAEVLTHGNFVSPELGVALAFPTLKEARGPWVVAYAALNIYFAPVERELPLGVLVGNPLLQRFSLTLGMSTATPGTVRGGNVSGVLGGNYAIAGAGLRLLPFARASLLFVFSEVTPANPASAQRLLVASPGVSISADIDVVTLLGSALTR